MNKAIRQRIELLTPLLKDPEQEVRSTVSTAIEYLEAVSDIDQILATLKTGDTGARITAVFALGKIGGEAVLAPLMYCATRPEEDIRAAAVEVLGNLAYPAVFQTLLASLDDSSCSVQARAIAALAHFPATPSLCARLRQFLDANDGMLEAEAATSLSRLGDITAIPGIIALLSSSHASTRIAAANALRIIPV